MRAPKASSFERLSTAAASSTGWGLSRVLVTIDSGC